MKCSAEGPPPEKVAAPAFQSGFPAPIERDIEQNSFFVKNKQATHATDAIAPEAASADTTREKVKRQTRSQRLERRNGGHFGFAKITKTVPNSYADSVPLEPEKSLSRQGFDPRWATVKKHQNDLLVITSPRILRHDVPCPGASAANDVRTILDCMTLLESERAPDEATAFVTASAPGALDGDRVDHTKNVLKQVTRAFRGLDREPMILTVYEQDLADPETKTKRPERAFHAAFVFNFPKDQWHRLKAIEAHRAVMQFDVPRLGNGLDVRQVGSPDYRYGIEGLARYLVKEARTGIPLDVGGTRVAVNKNLAARLTALGLYEPTSRQNRRRDLPRDPDLRYKPLPEAKPPPRSDSQPHDPAIVEQAVKLGLVLYEGDIAWFTIRPGHPRRKLLNETDSESLAVAVQIEAEWLETKRTIEAYQKKVERSRRYDATYRAKRKARLVAAA